MQNLKCKTDNEKWPDVGRNQDMGGPGSAGILAGSGVSFSRAQRGILLKALQPQPEAGPSPHIRIIRAIRGSKNPGPAIFSCQFYISHFPLI